MTSIESVKGKIATLNLEEPYVWRLRITTPEFEALGKELKSMLKANREYAIRKYPLLLITYIAEWYKRCYTGDNTDSALPLTSGELANLWENSGINIEEFVARQADGTARWLYSIYVLGGLALQFEMRRGDDGRFMRRLCSLYHGEEAELNVSEQSALSFRQSIERRQSLFEYIRAIVNGDFPFADEDLKYNSLFKDFIRELTEANIKALAKSDKFELIRGMWYEPGTSKGRRLLFLCMRPEETGRGCHGYLSYDRLRAWDAKDPDKIAWLSLSLRYYDKGRIIKDADFSSPIKEWSHTGWRESGMLCCGYTEIVCRDVPCRNFDTVEAVMKASTCEEFIVGKWQLTDYCQMWIKDEERMIWTDRIKQAADTVLFFSERWSPTPKEKTKEIRILTEDDALSDLSVKCFALQSTITLTDGANTAGPFFPTQGNLKLNLKRYDHLIMHSLEGTVKVMAGDDELSLPPIFYLSDVNIININQNGEFELIQPDKVEFLSRGKYKKWTMEESPDYGILTLRISKGARVWKIDVVYLQPVEETDPIVRDMECHVLHYVSDGSLQEIEDSISFEESALEVSPVVHRIIRVGNILVTLPLYRPSSFRRWVMDCHHSGFIFGDSYAVSWLLRNRVLVDELSASGYREYECSRLNKKLDLKGSLIDNWKEGRSIDARSMDEEAFSWLEINYGTIPPAEVPGVYVEWNLEAGEKPIKKCISNINEVKGIAFKDAGDSTSPEYGYPIFEVKDDDDDFWGDSSASSSPTALESFLIASEYQTYFALFHPFDYSEIINDSTIFTELIEPLRLHDGGRITESHLAGLNRLAEEFGFNIDITTLRK